MTEQKVGEPMRVPRSKLHPPVLSRPVIDRTWLFRRDLAPVDGAAGDPGSCGADATEIAVTLLSAPAGSGKTTLMSRWAQDRAASGHRVTWLSLDDTDDDPARFWTSLLAALGPAGTERNGGAGGDPGDAAVDQEAPLVQLELLVAESRLPVWLFLDDLQQVHSPDVLAQLSALLRGLPDGLRLVLATRRDPAVALHRLVLAGRLREIRAADLALTPAEVRQVLLDHGVRLAEQSLGLLVERTEGWAAGVRLAALTLAGAADPEALAQDFAGETRAVADYLTAEVLDGLSAGDRALLRVSAVPERVTGDLAVSVTGDPTATALLERLCRDNVLVVALEQPLGWYRMHHLLRGHLLGELRRTDPELLRTAQARTAEWFGRHGDRVRAIGHGVAAGDDELASRMLLDHGPSLLADGRARVLDGLIRSSSARVQGGSAVHDLATLASLEMDARLAPPIPAPPVPALPVPALPVPAPPIPAPRLPWGDDRVEPHPPEPHSPEPPVPEPHPPEPRPEPTPLGALLALQRVRRGDLALSGAALAQSAPMIDGRADDLGLLLRLGRGLVSLLAGDLPAAADELTAAAGQATRLRNDHALLQARAGLTALAASTGDYRGAWRRADETVRVASRLRAFRGPEIAAALLHAAQSRHQQLDSTGARHLAERAGAALDGTADVPLGIALTTLVAVLDVEDGRQPAAATRRIRDCWSRAGDRPVPALLVTYIAYAQHRCSWLVGRPDWAEEGRIELRRRVGRVGEPEVLGATEQLARGRGDAARKRLVPVLDGSLPCAHPLSLQQAWLVEAVLAARAGQSARGHEALQAALGLADELGALRPFLDMPGVPELLDDDVSRFGRLDHLVDQVRAAAQQRSQTPAPPLTPKELEVLADLPTQLTLEEIATRHQVSVNTVKTHVRSIYLKLGAQSRRAAITSARRRGLL